MGAAVLLYLGRTTSHVMSSEYNNRQRTTATYRSIELCVEFVGVGAEDFEGEHAVAIHGDEEGDVVS